MSSTSEESSIASTSISPSGSKIRAGWGMESHYFAGARPTMSGTQASARALDYVAAIQKTPDRGQRHAAASSSTAACLRYDISESYKRCSSRALRRTRVI